MNMSMQGNPSAMKCSCCNFHPKDRLNFVEMLLNNCLRCGHYHVDHRMTKTFDETTSQQQLNATECECDRTVSKEIGQYFELLLLDHNDKDKNEDKTKEIQDLTIRAIQTYKEKLKYKLEEPDESKYEFLSFKGCFKIKNGINALKKGKYGKSIYIFKMIIKKEFRNSKKARAKELLKLVGLVLESLKVLVNDSSNDLNLTIEIIKLLESINGYDKYQYDNPLVFILRYQKELEQYKNKTPSTTKDPKPRYRLRIMILPDKQKSDSFDSDNSCSTIKCGQNENSGFLYESNYDQVVCSFSCDTCNNDKKKDVLASSPKPKKSENDQPTSSDDCNRN